MLYYVHFKLYNLQYLMALPCGKIKIQSKYWTLLFPLDHPHLDKLLTFLNY